MSEKPTFPIIISQWDKNAREVVRVELDDFRGTKIVNARVWFRCGDDLRPTKSGLTLSVRHLPKLTAALCEAAERAHALGFDMDRVTFPLSTDGDEGGGE